HIYQAKNSLWEADGEPAGFQWIDANNASENVVSFIRRSPSTGKELICVGNFAPVLRENHRLGLPRNGKYRMIVNTDSAEYGGSGTAIANSIKAEENPIHGLKYSAVVTLPPLATLWFEAPGARSTASN
ncbi:MAG: alpha amylase C-terminal domain-containing protein, partial [Acidobacteriota bacterium]|nr:alpha amylase C-terminal domain-containing protein [Acidobacteriota bacterium]